MEIGKFKKGDKVIWLKPVEMEIIDDDDLYCVVGKVINDGTPSERDKAWTFLKDSGIWNYGRIETRGIIVHPGFTVISGPEPKRKPACTFKDRELVLVRDCEDCIWKIAAFRGFDDDAEYPYDTYNEERFRYCIPYAGNEYKLGEVTCD